MKYQKMSQHVVHAVTISLPSPPCRALVVLAGGISHNAGAFRRVGTFVVAISSSKFGSVWVLA